jgi:hypothetical protein
MRALWRRGASRGYMLIMRLHAEHVLDAAPLTARLDAIRLAGTAFDKATRLVERSNPGLDEAVGMLDTLAAGFKAAAAELRASEDGEGDDSAR